MKIGTGKNLVLAGIWHQLQVTEDTVEKRMKQLAVRDEASRRAASAAVEKQLKAVKEYSKCTSVPQPETSRSPEREARVLGVPLEAPHASAAPELARRLAQVARVPQPRLLVVDARRHEVRLERVWAWLL